MPCCCKNAPNMLQKCCNFTMHILIIIFLLSGHVCCYFLVKNATIVDTNQLSWVLYLLFFLFFNFISNTFCIILVPNNQGFSNASIVKSKFYFSIHFSECFVTVPNGPITTVIISTFLIFQIFAISYFSSL